MQKKNPFFKKIWTSFVFGLKCVLYFFNLVLLIGLGVRACQLWISDSKGMSEILSNYPLEPEFLNLKIIEQQVFILLVVQTLIFVVGSFLCYAMFLRKRSIRRLLVAPFVALFLWATAESFVFFLPVTAKVENISSCISRNFNWHKENHKCDFVSADIKRIRQKKN